MLSIFVERQHLLSCPEGGGPADGDGVLDTLMSRAALRMHLQRPLGRLPGRRGNREVVVHVDRRDAVLPTPVIRPSTVAV
jgi:hypothetical protein